MLSSINNQNQPQFTARFRLKNVTNGLEHLQKAAKAAEAKTEKIPYNIGIEAFPNDGINIYAVSKDGFEHILATSQETFEKMLKLTPEKLTNKLVKLVKLFAKEDKENNKIIKFLTHLEKSKSAPHELFIDNYAPLAEINVKDTRLALDKDKLFRDFEYMS
ncbi:MAG: hypothetical protein NC191_02310 [Muribaculaceae bacterium]|nr:hypothetical protein [Muribaculaceae bacterium]